MIRAWCFCGWHCSHDGTVRCMLAWHFTHATDLCLAGDAASRSNAFLWHAAQSLLGTSGPYATTEGWCALWHFLQSACAISAECGRWHLTHSGIFRWTSWQLEQKRDVCLLLCSRSCLIWSVWQLRHASVTFDPKTMLSGLCGFLWHSRQLFS